MIKCRYVALLVLVFADSAYANSPPISAFANGPVVRRPVISPDGRFLALVTTVDQRTVAITRDLSNGGAAKVVVDPKGGNVQLESCDWANTTRLICSFSVPMQVIISDTNGRQQTLYRLVAMDADGKNFATLGEFAKSTAPDANPLILDWTRDDPQSVLIARPDGVYSLDVYTGKSTRQSPRNVKIDGYYSDGRGNVRLAVEATPDGTEVIFHARLLGSDKWQELSKVTTLWRGNALTPIAVIPATNRAYAIGSHSERNAVWEIDLEGKAPPQLLFDDPHFDVSEPVRINGELAGFEYEAGRPSVRYLDANLSATMRSIDKALPASSNYISSATLDGNKLIVTSRSDVDAGSYYFFDKQTGKLSLIGRVDPDLPSDALGRMRSIEFPAQDGVMIPAFLIEPPGVRPEKLPLVVIPVNGLLERHSWQFHLYGQFLATRGYAVLLTNSRGASGYGEKWAQAARRDWGGLPYSDTTDGVRWATAQGIADPSRVCILGEHWGGYTALIAAVKNSGMYRCVVSINGRSDMYDLARSLEVSRLSRSKTEMSLEVEPGTLRKDAPIKHVDEIKTPILLIHAAINDEGLGAKQLADFAKALANANKPHKYLQIKTDDLRLAGQAELTAVLEELEKFLTVNIGQ